MSDKPCFICGKLSNQPHTSETRNAHGRQLARWGQSLMCVAPQCTPGTRLACGTCDRCQAYATIQYSIKTGALKINVGDTFDTPFESGCVVVSLPDETGGFDAYDSEDVLCSFSFVMIIAHQPKGN